MGLAENSGPRDSTPLWQEGGRRKFYLFNPVLDEEELAGCLHELYVDSAKSMKMSGHGGCDKLKFSAFLYYLVMEMGIKGDNFNQTCFYQFIQEKVFKELTQTVRTFNNRVNDLKLLTQAAKHPADFARHPDFCYFQRLKSKFRESDFFMSLKRLRSSLSNFL